MTRWQRARVALARYFDCDITLRASNGVDVLVHWSFARDYWRDPGRWQETLDSRTIRWED